MSRIGSGDAAEALALGAVAAGVALQGFSLPAFAIICTLLAGAAAAALIGCRRRGLPVAGRALPLLLVLLIAWAGAGTALSVLPQWSPFGLLLVGLLPAAYLVYCALPDRERFQRRLLALLAAIGTVLFLVVLWQGVIVRVQPAGPFVQKNTLAGWLLLAALPLSAWYARGTGPRGPRRALAAVICACFLVIAWGASRAALGAFIVGFGLFYALLPRPQRLREGRVLLALALWAWFVALAWPGGEARERVGSLIEVSQRMDVGRLELAGPLEEAGPVASVNQRLVLWKASAAMLADAPWHGFGPGTYRLLYPAYSPAADRTDRYYAHNDYLQLLIELGWPGLALWIAVPAAVGVGLLRARGAPAGRRIELAGLGAGITAVAAQSMFTYNFYVPAIVVLFGFALARFADLAAGRVPVALIPVGRWFGARTFALVCVLGAAVPCAYAWAGAGMGALYERGVERLLAGDLTGATAALSRAAALHDNERVDVAFAHVWLAAFDAAASPADRSRLLGLAEQAVQRALRRNPWSPLPYYGLAALRQRDPGLQPDERHRLTLHAFAQALQRDPRHYPSRLELARYLLAQGRTADARAVLEDGLRWAFPAEPGIIAYADLLAHLRRRSGDPVAAERLEERMERLRPLLGGAQGSARAAR